MAIDRAVDSGVLDSGLTSIANAIRSKGGTSAQLSFPSGMKNAVDAIPTKQLVSWHQCPDAVKSYLAYLEEHPYLPSDYGSSVIETYYGDDATNSKPIGKTVDGVTYYNEVPNEATPFVSTNAAGSLTPLDMVRWIKAYSAWSYDVRNCRDLGGWPCDGGTVKYGKLFRNGDISSYNAPVLVGELRVGAELDLDQAHLEESSKLGNILYHGAIANIQYSLTNTEAWKDILGFVFYCVLNNIVLDFHCAVGCDRTGTLAAIIEAILGVSQSDIDTDYEMSSFAGASWLRKRNGTAYQSFISQINALSVGTTFRDKVINWVASLGFTATEINTFRAQLIDGNPETVTPIIETYDVTKSGSNVVFGNQSATVDQYQPYECDITPADGYVIDSVVVTVNGVDKTSEYLTGEYIEVGTKDIISNGITDVAGYSKVNVNVPQGITPTGTKMITNTQLTDVTEYASAQVSDSNLVSENIKDGVSVLGVVGTYAGGGGATNCKRFTMVVTKAAANTQYNIVTGDTDVASHYADDTAFAVVFKNYPRTDTVGLVASICANTPVSPSDATSHIIYGNTTESSVNSSHIAGTLKTEGTQAGKITAYSNGDLKIYSQSSNNVIRVGTYTVLFCW